MNRICRVLLSAVAVAALLFSDPSEACGESPLGHEITLGLTGVYDAGYDRGLQYGLSYELSWSLLRAWGVLALGHNNVRDEQHWALGVGVVAWDRLRIDVGFHHRTFTPLGFGENLIRFSASLSWRGLEFATGYILRFPIIGRDQIHNPVVFDTALFEHFLLFRLGYIWSLPSGFGIGLLAGNYSRFEIHNLDYPQFALVATFEHPRVGRLRLDIGMGTAGFFNMGATIDRFFVRFEYSRLMRRRATSSDEQEPSP